MTDSLFRLAHWQPETAVQLIEIHQAALRDDDLDLQRNTPELADAVAAARFAQKLAATEAEGTMCARVILGTGETEGRVLGQVMASQIERTHSTAWISYWLRPEARGRGIASAALRQCVDILHDECGIYRLELGHRVDNSASGHVAAAAGFLLEGTERQRLAYGTQRYDVHRWARLAGDPRPWQRSRQGHTASGAAGH
ncbi:GNAT family N-acetyltransferase [Brevibacterium luteolum]|uniref:GNAT family N-acetyltransferase n=1 Tax=Brevibacterium luteolum TaxID=199591 RepID=A0A849ANP5_9MICO|nr:GNAT family protein [Brevibacterium luteolum]MBM7528267.1 RimJ/RimL family protein N-acetyltransferase [Brevibacterium luteolum]NNG78373.1 GNAT family N-acetyltransferase [Brevibacterium luteolum]